MEYVTDRFIQEIEREIIAEELELLRTHALIEPQAQDYIRSAQIQLILQPLVDRLLTHFTTRMSLEQQLSNIYTTRNISNHKSHDHTALGKLRAEENK
jgi:hypothetical protein